MSSALDYGAKETTHADSASFGSPGLAYSSSRRRCRTSFPDPSIRVGEASRYQDTGFLGFGGAFCGGQRVEKGSGSTSVITDPGVPKRTRDSRFWSGATRADGLEVWPLANRCRVRTGVLMVVQDCLIFVFRRSTCSLRTRTSSWSSRTRFYAGDVDTDVGQGSDVAQLLHVAPAVEASSAGDAVGVDQAFTLIDP
jgi:hypothetical protein